MTSLIFPSLHRDHGSTPGLTMARIGAIVVFVALLGTACAQADPPSQIPAEVIRASPLDDGETRIDFEITNPSEGTLEVKCRVKEKGANYSGVSVYTDVTANTTTRLDVALPTETREPVEDDFEVTCRS